MRKDSAQSGFHVGLSAQPVELRGDVVVEQCRKQPLVGESNLRAGVDRVSIGRARHVAQQPLQKAAQHVGRPGRVEVALFIELPDKGERQRMAMGKGDHSVMLGLWDADPRQICACLGGAQVV